MVGTLLLAAFVALTSFSRASLLASSRTLPTAARSEVLYLPNGQALKAIAFGYDNLLADILWFNTINYFGKHFRSDQNYEWLKHMCNLVLDLDPRASHVYHFCSSMLAWMAHDPDGARLILDRAIERFPDDWRYYYLRGFTYMYFLGDSERAHQDFRAGAELDNADPTLARLAARKLAELNRPEEAAVMLASMIKNARSRPQREALQQRYREVLYEIGFKWNTETVNRYRDTYGRTPESLESLAQDQDVLRQGHKVVLQDPYGGRYYIDAATGEVRSSSGRKRINRFRKTPLQMEEAS